MARTILGVADVEQNCLGIDDYRRLGSCQLRANRRRNDKNSGGLFQFFLRQRNKYEQTFFRSLDGVNHQKRHRFISGNCGNLDDFYARTGRSDNSFRINIDGYSGQTSA